MTGADFNVGARGDNQPFANKMLVMVDGRSIYLDAGNVFWKSLPITLPEIKRIEVLKGPASAMYGFNAFDGVINIITKSPEEMKGTTFNSAEGARHHQQRGRPGGYSRQFGYRLSIGRDQTQQWRDGDAQRFARTNSMSRRTMRCPRRRSCNSGGLVETNRYDGQVGEVTSNSIRPSFGYANAVYEHGAFLVRAWWSGYTDHATINPLPISTRPSQRNRS